MDVHLSIEPDGIEVIVSDEEWVFARTCLSRTSRFRASGCR